MKQQKIPAVFMRGGTSKAIIFRQDDLPEDRSEWDEIFLAALGRSSWRNMMALEDRKSVV